MKWWFWSSKEETAQKNFRNYIDRLNAEVETLRALNLTDNDWAKQAITDLGQLTITLQALIKNKDPLPAGNSDLTAGGTRKKRKNKKHKKKTYRH